jgi:HK97 family phage major capsid protein
MQQVAGKQVNGALRKFASAREGARRFHRSSIGAVNPDFCFGHWLVNVGKACSQRHHEQADGVATLQKTYGKSLAKRWGHLDVLDPSGLRTKTALSVEAGGASGGYLVPQQLYDDLMVDVSEESFVRPEALKQPMDSATLDLPLPDAETATGTAGVPPFFGGIQLKWTSEAVSIGETAETSFRSVSLRANDLTGYALVSNPLMQDAMGLDAWLRRLFGKSVAWFEDYAFMRGTGVGQPLGVLNSGAAIKVNRNASSHVKYVDTSGMLTKLLPYSYLHASWLFTVSSTSELVQLIDSSGKTAWVPNYPNQRDGEKNRSIGLLFNRPMYVTEKLPALGTLGDVVLFDPSLYVIGDRQAMEIAVSPHPQFKTNQSVWRIVERVDGRPWFDQTITLADQATVVSSIVQLN